MKPNFDIIVFGGGYVGSESALNPFDSPLLAALAAQQSKTNTVMMKQGSDIIVVGGVPAGRESALNLSDSPLLMARVKLAVENKRILRQ